MAKLSLQEQIKATKYRQPNTDENFEDIIITNQGSRSSGNISLLSLNKLVEYKDEAFEKIAGRPQPFRSYTKKDLDSLAKSIAEYGVIDPITVRPMGSGRYQILAGRNRARASALCGKADIPAIIRHDIDDVTAAMIMLDTNLEQRHNLLYSEKAFAYKMRMELQNQQGRRSDLKGGQKIDTLSEVGKQNKDSRRTVSYLIRLTVLIPEILALVDNRKVGFKAGVEISYLREETQNYLYYTVIPKGIKMSPAYLNKLRQLETETPLPAEVILSVFNTKNLPNCITISGKRLQKYADILSASEDIESLFLEVLEQYKNMKSIN